MSLSNRRREIWLASVFALALTGTAGAADLAVKAPIVAPVPVFSWTGVYLGIGGGVGWGNKEYTWDQDATLVAIAAQMGGFNAPFPLLGGTQGSHPISGGFFGGQLGANWQAGWAVFGIQADAHWADIEGHGSCFDTGIFQTIGLSFSCNDKVSSFGTVTGRVGAAIDRALIYAKGGWAWESGQHTLNATLPASIINDNGPQALVSGITGTSSLNESRTGWTFGAGVEYAFAPNWSAFVEYDYFDFGTKGVNNTLVVTQTPGNNPPSFTFPIQANSTEKFNVIKVGLNYKFSWWGAPVVARY